MLWFLHLLSLCILKVTLWGGTAGLNLRVGKQTRKGCWASEGQSEYIGSQISIVWVNNLEQAFIPPYLLFLRAHVFVYWDYCCIVRCFIRDRNIFCNLEAGKSNHGTSSFESAESFLLVPWWPFSSCVLPWHKGQGMLCGLFLRTPILLIRHHLYYVITLSVPTSECHHIRN